MFSPLPEPEELIKGTTCKLLLLIKHLYYATSNLSESNFIHKGNQLNMNIIVILAAISV